MRTITNFVITLAAVTLFAACSNPKKTAETDTHEGHNHAAGEGHGTATAADFDCSTPCSGWFMAIQGPHNA